MKPIKNTLIFAVILLFTSSCASYLQISVNLPPEIALNENEKTVQFISFYDPLKLDFGNEKRTRVFISGTEKLISGLEKSFRTNIDYTFFSLDSIIRGRALSSFPGPLSPDMVKYYCNLNNTSLLLALEDFDIFYDKESETFEDEPGIFRTIVHYLLVVKAGFTLYDSTGMVVDRTEVASDEYIDSREAIVLDIAIRPSFANKQTEVDRMAYAIGSQYISKFYATTRDETRKYYTGKEFSQITPYMTDGRWEKAVELLLPLANYDNLELKRKAAHNLGVAYEALGDMEASKNWYAKSKAIRMK